MKKTRFLLIFVIVVFCGVGVLAATNAVRAEEVKPDLTIKDIYIENDLVKVEYCNDGTDPIDVNSFGIETFYIKVVANSKTHTGTSNSSNYIYSVPGAGQCAISDGLPLSYFDMLASKNYLVTATIDHLGEVEESSESNNILGKTVTIAGESKPDLTINDAYFTPNDPILGQFFTGKLHIKLANNGGVVPTSGPDIDVRVALSSNYTGIMWNNSGSKFVDGMEANSVKDVVFDVNYAKFTNAPLEIRVWVDSNAIGDKENMENDNLSIDESNENNNTLFKKITLKAENNDILNYKMDRIALNSNEIPSGYKISHLTYQASDVLAMNNNLSKAKDNIQQTFQSSNYNHDRQYYTTGLRLYDTAADAVVAFENQNTMHAREIITLSSSEKFGDDIFCHKSPSFTTINKSANQPDIYYFYCSFRYANIFIDTQAQTTFNNYKIVLSILKEYYKNIENYDESRIPPVPGLTSEEVKDSQLVKINQNAKDIIDDKYDSILSEIKQLRDVVKEQASRIKYLDKLVKNVEKLSEKMESAINNFITYGVDDNTQKLGEGERAAVMYSYKSAFDKLPETEAELADAIRIANGRWPSITNDEAEKKAKEQFQKIYQRIADMNNANDNAAVTVMAYGLRQKAENRNLESERNGINIFKNIYGYTPSSTEDWNIMQAITYSGSARGVDSDGDLLTDEREAELGTDPGKKDTDGDGYMDGIEVANGYDPLKK